MGKSLGAKIGTSRLSIKRNPRKSQVEVRHDIETFTFWPCHCSTVALHTFSLECSPGSAGTISWLAHGPRDDGSMGNGRVGYDLYDGILDPPYSRFGVPYKVVGPGNKGGEEIPSTAVPGPLRFSKSAMRGVKSIRLSSTQRKGTWQHSFKGTVRRGFLGFIHQESAYW